MSRIPNQAPPAPFANAFICLQNEEQNFAFKYSIYIRASTSNSKSRPHPPLNQLDTVLKFTCNFFINSVYINRLVRCTNSLLNRVIIKKVRQQGEKLESTKRASRNGGTSPLHTVTQHPTGKKKYTHEIQTEKKKLLWKVKVAFPSFFLLPPNKLINNLHSRLFAVYRRYVDKKSPPRPQPVHYFDARP